MSRLLVDLPIGDPKSGDQAVVTEIGWGIDSPDKDGVTLTREFSPSGGFVAYLTANGYTQTGDTITGPGLPVGGLSVKDIGIPILSQFYDTIIGVGDSITDGEFKTNNQFENDNNVLIPYRGTKFDSAAVPGTTLQFMIDNIDRFTSKSNGRTLYIVRAGINDANTYLSSGGVTDGSGGSVTGWDDMTQTQKDLVNSQYRQLVSLLEPFGDVALATITYCDAKGQLQPLQDNGRNTHTGSWNDAVVVPLCQELTPDFFDSGSGRPVFDYYMETFNSPETLDSDNLHFYADRDYMAVSGGYPNGSGSYTLRKYLLDTLITAGAIKPSPLDSRFSDRLSLSLGRGLATTDRPFHFRRGNNLDIPSATTGNITDLTTLNNVSGAAMSWTSSWNLGARTNVSAGNNDWTEHLLDSNALSSGIFNQSGRTWEITMSGIGKGVVSFAGLFSNSGVDAAAVTKLTLTDDLGTRDITFDCSYDSSLGLPFEEFAEAEYDTTVGGTLVIDVNAADGATYGMVSTMQFDME